MNTETRRQELVAAMNHQFPESGFYAQKPQDEDQASGEREADRYFEQAAQQLGHPITSNTVGLTRGDATQGRITELRRELDRAWAEGHADAALEIELNHLTDQLQELEMTGQADQAVELARPRSRAINTPRVHTPWHPAS